MFSYSFFDTVTGYFAYLVTTQDENYINYPFPVGFFGATGDYSSGDYFYEHGGIVPIQRMPLVYSGSFSADGVSVWTCSGIPVGAEIIWPDGVRTTEVDGIIEFVTDAPGRHTFQIVMHPYKTEVLNIEAINN